MITKLIAAKFFSWLNTFSLLVITATWGQQKHYQQDLELYLFGKLKEWINYLSNGTVR